MSKMFRVLIVLVVTHCIGGSMIASDQAEVSNPVEDFPAVSSLAVELLQEVLEIQYITVTKLADTYEEVSLARVKAGEQLSTEALGVIRLERRGLSRDDVRSLFAGRELVIEPIAADMSHVIAEEQVYVDAFKQFDCEKLLTALDEARREVRACMVFQDISDEELTSEQKADLTQAVSRYRGVIFYILCCFGNLLPHEVRDSFNYEKVVPVDSRADRQYKNLRSRPYSFIDLTLKVGLYSLKNAFVTE